MTCKDLSYEELDKYKDFDVTSSVLAAAADHLHQECKDANDVYMLCRSDTNRDPRACLRQGQAVTNCTKVFLHKVFKQCKEPFLDYTTCLDCNKKEYDNCRREQKKFDICALEKLGIAREWTYYQDHIPPPAQTWGQAIREMGEDIKNIIKEPIFDNRTCDP